MHEKNGGSHINATFLWIALAPFAIWSLCNIIGAGFYSLSMLFSSMQISENMYHGNWTSINFWSMAMLGRLCWFIVSVLFISVVNVAFLSVLGFFLLFISKNFRNYIVMCLIVNVQIPVVARVLAWKIVFPTLPDGITSILYEYFDLDLAIWRGIYIYWVLYNVLFVISFFPVFLQTIKISNNIIFAALDLGASYWMIFQRIYLPLMYHGLLDSYRISVVIASGAYVIVDFIGEIRNGSIGGLLTDMFFNLGSSSVVIGFNMVALVSILFILWLPNLLHRVRHMI